MQIFNKMITKRLQSVLFGLGLKKCLQFHKCCYQRTVAKNFDDNYGSDASSFHCINCQSV